MTTAAPQTLLIDARVVSPDPRTNTATISHSDQFDPVGGNNSASATETPQLADLALSKTVDNPMPNVGDTITFTVTLTNKEPDTATHVKVQDVLPAGLSFVSYTASQGTYESVFGVWNVGTVTTAASPTLQIRATVASSGTRINTADILDSDQFDPDRSNNSASAIESPRQADLALAKSVSNASPNVGDTITFTVTLTNNGPDPATNAHVTDLLPAGLTFVSDSASQGAYDSTTGVWTVGTVTVGTPQTLQIQATVASPNAQTNAATITDADQFDPDLTNNGASATETPQQADLRVTKSVNNAAPNVGDTITFTVTLSNLGPNTATNVQVADLLPAGLSFVSSNPSQGNYLSGTGVWTIGTVTAAAPQTLQIQAKVLGPAAQTNTASISHADQFDPVTTNNSASATETPQQADLALAKSVSNARPNVGDTITFTITLTDKGPSTATNVKATDLLPTGLTFVSATPSQGTYVSATGIWSVGTVTTTTPQTLQIQAVVATPAAKTNIVSISGADQFDPIASNNNASATETPQRSDLVLSKTVTSATPNVGDIITYDVMLGNLGPDTATDVQVTDVLPTGLIFVSATPSQGTYVAGSGLWTVGTVPTTSPQSLLIRARVLSPNPVTNTATISNSDQFDPDTANNSATATETPQQADLALNKTVNQRHAQRRRHDHVHGDLDQQRRQHGHQRASDRSAAGGADFRVGYTQPGDLCRRNGNLEAQARSPPPRRRPCRFKREWPARSRRPIRRTSATVTSLIRTPPITARMLPRRRNIPIWP